MADQTFIVPVALHVQAENIDLAFDHVRQCIRPDNNDFVAGDTHIVTNNGTLIVVGIQIVPDAILET